MLYRNARHRISIGIITIAKYAFDIGIYDCRENFSRHQGMQIVEKSVTMSQLGFPIIAGHDGICSVLM